MSEILTNEQLLKFKAENRCITATDGNVGAVFLDGSHFITSPNQHRIPKPPIGSNRKVFLREDSLYGDDDPMRWPQPYNSVYCHHGAIPRPGSLSAHLIIWWRPTEYDHDAYTHSMVSITGLGKLRERRFRKLQDSVSFLISRVTEFTSSIPESKIPLMLGPMMKMLEHGMTRLQSMWMNLPQMTFTVRDVQRCWLEITAFLDYMLVFKPRMDSITVNAQPHPAADTMGVFTSEIRVAQDFFHAGLPCWLIRPASVWSDINILKVIPVASPDGRIVLEPHPVYCPPVYVGPATAPEKYHAILRFARGFLRYPDPFSIAIDEEDTHVKALGVLSRAASSTTGARSSQSSSKEPVPDKSRDTQSRGKTPYEGSRKPTSMRHKKEKPAPTGRNKFLPYESPLMPLLIPAWSDALQAVNRDQPPLSYNTRYVFPEAALFASTNESRRAKFFATWIAIRPACMYRIISVQKATPLSNQQWRDFLLDGLLSLSKQSTLVRRREEVKSMFAGALEELKIDFHALSPDSFPDMSLSDMQSLLWELTELNFRFELLALDKRASSCNRDEDERQAMVLKCFPDNDLLLVNPGIVNVGLQSLDYWVRLPYLLALKALLRDWDGLKPTPLLLPDLPFHDYTELDVRQLEESIARFYTQSFYHFFGRAATVPKRLPL